MRWKRSFIYILVIAFLVVVSILLYQLVLADWKVSNTPSNVELLEVDPQINFKEEEIVEEIIYEFSYHRDDDPPFFPKPKRIMTKFSEKRERSNFYYGYYFGDHIDLEGKFVKQPPIVEIEDIDCEEFTEKHREIMLEKGMIIDIKERSNKTNFNDLDLKVWKLWNDDYFDYNHLFSYICEEKKFRMAKRHQEKTEVKWKEGDPVIILTHWDQWNALKPHMHVNCEFEFELIPKTDPRNNSSHIRLYQSWQNSRTFEKENYGEIYSDHYRGLFTIESCSQVTYDKYLMAMHNYDYLLSYHTLADIPIYNDWDPELYLIQLNVKDVIVQNDFKKDHLKTYDQLRKETIHYIRKYHKSKKHCCTAFISHCDEYGSFDRKNLDNRAYKLHKNPNHVRPNLVNAFHDRFKVINYGRCRGKHKMDTGTEKKSKGSTTVGSKIKYQNQYPFYLAFENRMIDGYTGAKLMQALLAKYTIPIYYGDPFIEQKFPPELLKNYKVFIDLVDFNTISDALDYIEYLMKNETAYLEYFEWRFDKVYRFLPRVTRYGLHDYFDSEGNNVVPWCRLAELFVTERLTYYPEQSKRDLLEDEEKKRKEMSLLPSDVTKNSIT